MGQDNFQGSGQFFIFVAIIKKFRMVDCVFSFMWYNLNLLFFKYLLIIIKSALFILMDVSVNINFFNQIFN